MATSTSEAIPILAVLSLMFTFLLSLRLLFTLPALRRRPPIPRTRGTPTRILIVLGSGGHTAEMLSLLRNLDTHSYTHRSYVISSGDGFSARKAVEFEEMLKVKAQKTTTKSMADSNGITSGLSQMYGNYDIAFVPRARCIHQSLLTTPISSLRCLVACFSVLRFPAIATVPIPSSPRVSPCRSYPPPLSTSARFPASTNPTYPDLILTNGPATAAILILATFLLRFLALPGTANEMRIVYVESWARVRRLSLSGKILAWCGMCERFIVQWQGLAREGQAWGGWGRKEFKGALVR